MLKQIPDQKWQEHIAIVYTFSGEVRKLHIDRVWYWQGKPERVFGTDENGVRYKHKMDEEPFMVVRAFVSDVGLLGGSDG